MKFKRFALTALVLCLCLGAWNLEVNATSSKATGTSQAYALTRPVITLSNDFDSGKIGVSWNTVAGAVGYEVHRSENNSTWDLLTSTTEIEILDSTAEAGKTYYYKVRAIAENASGNSVFSSSKSRTCDLARPEIISVGNSEITGKVSLTWSAVEDAVQYRVYRCNTSNGVYDLVATTTNTNLVNTSTVAGETYYYKVQALAKNTAAHSALSPVVNQVCDLPRPVISLSSTAGSGKITVSWEEIVGAVQYEVYRCEDEGDWSLLITNTNTKISDTEIVPGVTYSYKVKAVAENPEANSAYSAEKAKTYVLGRPEITLSNDAATGEIVVSWKPVDGAVAYEVYRSTKSDGGYKLVNTTTETSLRDDSAAQGVKYYYKVKAAAENSAGNSSYSTWKSGTYVLLRPVITLSNDAASGKVVVSWKAVHGAVAYEIYRSTKSDSGYKLVDTTPETSWKDDSTEAGKTYYYKVKAVAENAAGNSSYSGWKSKVCDLARPEITSVGNSEISGKISLTWTAVDGAVEYRVYRSESADGEYEWVATAKENTLINSSVEAGKTYFYKIQARSSKSDAHSAQSEAMSGVCKLPRTVVSLSSTAGSGKITVSWEAVAGAVQYEIFRAEDGGDWAQLTISNGTKITDTAVRAGVTYSYKVIAVAEDTAANSAFSAEKSKTYVLGRPEITLSNDAATVVSWKSVDGAVAYEIYRSTKSDGGYELVNTTTETSLRDDSSAQGVKYYYKVKAVAENVAGNSSYSTWKSGTYVLLRPVITLSNDAASGKVVVSWKTVHGAVAYEIYRSTKSDSGYKLVDTTPETSWKDDSAQAGTKYYYKVKAIAENAAGNSSYSGWKSKVCDLARPEITSVGNSEISGKISLTWTAVDGAVEYRVYRSESADGEYEWVATAKENTLINSSVEAGKTYFYKIQARSSKSDAHSAQSDAVSGVCKLPRTVVSLSSTAGSGKITVSWEAVAGAVQYEIFRAEDGGDWAQLTTSNGTKITDTAIQAGVTYSYKVIAVAEDTAANSAFSAEKSKTYVLGRPEITMSNDAATGKVVVSWKPVDGAVGYEVYRSTKSDSGYKLVDTTPETSWKDDSAEVGTTYYYKVKATAENSVGNSSYSGWKSCTCKLSQPEVTLINDPATGRILLSWDTIDGAVEYKVYRSDAQNGTYTRIRTTTGLSYMDQSGEMGKTYYYKIQAVAETTSANSAYSSIVTGVGQYLNDLTVSIALNAEGKPRLDWNSVQGADSYNVYRTMLPTGEFERIGNTQNLYRINSSAASGVTFYYKVVAVDADGNEFQESVNVASITTPLLGEETLVTRYTVAHRVAIYDLPDSGSNFEYLPYMSELQLGMAVTDGNEGTWYRAFYENELYYVWLVEESEKLVSEKSNFDYYSEHKHIQEVLDLAKDISLNWDTVYAHEQSKGEQNADGTYGFDCSGFVSYVFNTVMQRYIPIYRVSADIETLRMTENICGLGYSNELNAADVEMEDLQPGDVLFFSQVDPYDHCGIYLGNGEFAHSSWDWAHTSVIIMPLADMYLEDLVMIRRYLPTNTAPANEVVTVKPTAADGTLFRTCPLYEKANDESTKLLTLQAGDQVTVLYTSTNWAQVRTADGVLGYVVVRNLSNELLASGT